MENSLFSSNTYVEAIELKMEAEGEAWGQITRLAEAANCQRSHLSRVLAGESLLTFEQADGLCSYWNFDETEAEYFLSLLALARAGTPSLRRRHELKLREIRKQQENLSTRLNRPHLETGSNEVLYYSAWYWSAIHIAVTIDHLQTVDSIAKKLSLSPEIVKYVLEQLEQMQLVKSERQHWKFASQTVHLPRSSPLIGFHHSNWKQKAVADAQDPASDGVHYSVVQSVSRADFDRIKQNILNVISEYNRIAEPSPSEELICLTCDFFRL